VSYRSCPGCGFLVGLDADTCPLCAQGLDAVDAPGETTAGAGAHAPVDLPEPDPTTAAWPALPPPDAFGDPAEAARPAERESAALPLFIAVLCVLAMLGLTMFGNQERPAHATAPLITVPDPEVVAATLPTTAPPGWRTYTDPGSTFLLQLPGIPSTLEAPDAEGRTVHHVEVVSADGTVGFSWVEVADTPWRGGAGAAYLEAAARATVPPGGELTSVRPLSLGGADAVEVRYRTADGAVGVVAAAGHGTRLVRLSATGTAADVVLAAYERAAASLVLT